MDWLRQQMRDHVSNVRPFPTAERAAHPETARTLPGPRSDALELVHAAADVLRNMQEKSAAAEARARQFAHRASEEIKRARDRIQALEADCERLNGLVARYEDQLRDAQEALDEAQARITELETQLAASEQRAGEAEDTVMLIEDAIRSEILEPKHSKTKVSAAA